MAAGIWVVSLVVDVTVVVVIIVVVVVTVVVVVVMVVIGRPSSASSEAPRITHASRTCMLHVTCLRHALRREPQGVTRSALLGEHRPSGKTASVARQIGHGFSCGCCLIQPGNRPLKHVAVSMLGVH